MGIIELHNNMEQSKYALKPVYDGKRAIIHHLSVHTDYCRPGIVMLIQNAKMPCVEKALQKYSG